MAEVIHKGSEKHKLHLSLLAADKAEVKKETAADKAEGVKIPERKTENK